VPAEGPGAWISAVPRAAFTARTRALTVPQTFDDSIDHHDCPSVGSSHAASGSRPGRGGGGEPRPRRRRAQRHRERRANHGGRRGPYFPDNLAPGEVYLDLLPFHPDTPLTALRSRVADETKSVQAGHVDYVNYVDGLNMALPSFARLGVLDRNESELAAMQK